jgi:deferrochelatase/peroxidase EfeB
VKGVKGVNEVGRRGFLASAAAVAGAGLVAADHGAAAATVRTPANVPFHGLHQAGILTPAQRATAFVSFDTTAENRGELTDLLRTLTDRARFLTSGGSPDELGITAPPADSGTLGTDIPADRLTG